MPNVSKNAKKALTPGKKIVIGLDPKIGEIKVPTHMHGSVQPDFLQLEMDPTNVKRVSIKHDAKSGKITIHLD